MDFGFTEAQTAIVDLARKLFAERATPAALKAMEAEEDRFHAPLWREMAGLGLLGTAIDEPDGGQGHGLLELCALMQEAGGAALPLPLWPTLALGALPIAKFGTPDQRRLLGAVARGEAVLTAALAEYDSDDPSRPSATARLDGATWVLDGTKTCVPAARIAARLLVAARTTKDAIGVFLVDPKAPGVTLSKQVTTSGETQYEVALRGVRVGREDVLGDPERGVDVLAWLVPRATVALSAVELGIAERVLRMTASYTTERRQFDRPIATFQAVAQRAGDAYIDVESIRVAVWQAAWRLANDLPAETEVSVAKFFAAEAGHRVVFAAQHLHGGMGFDLDYPLHRYYLLSKQIELTLGGASAHLARIGAELARGG